VEVAALICAKRGPNTVVTDCASVKSEIVTWADKNKIPEFIAGHPMAGHEKSGAEYASAWMFRNARWILMPTKLSSKGALATVEELVRTMGATPIRLEAESHDRHVALLSHLPHAIAAVLVSMAESLDHVEVGAGSWRDLTRVGGVDAGLWTQILIENRRELTKVIAEFQDDLGEIRRMLDQKDSGAIFKLLSEAQKAKAKQEKAPGSESAKIYKPGKRRF
jgi:prephenate dehydrogenase